MSAAEDGGRAAQVDAFALLVRDGFVPHRKAVNALLRDSYFAPTARPERKPPAGYYLARGMAWVVDRCDMAFSEASDIIAMTLRQQGAADMGVAMDRADRLLSITMTELETHRTSTAKELSAAISRIERPAAPVTATILPPRLARPIAPGVTP